MDFNKTTLYTVIILFIALIYFPLFLHLGTLTLHMWDEAGNAVNAVEMAFNGNYIRRYYNGHPDYFETKPPFFIWLQVLFLKITGYNELSIRLPSALFALATIGVIVRFFKKEFNSIYEGIICCLILITSSGYVGEHVTRTGDHDAVLTFFQTVIVLYFFKFLFHKDKRRKYIAIFFTAITLAVLTKSVAGVLMLPGLFMFTLFTKRTKYVLTYPGIYIGLSIMLCIIGGYYLWANYLDPLYIKTVWENEFLPRYFNTGKIYKYNVSPFTFYLDNFIKGRFFPWIYLLPFSVIALFILTKNDKIKQFILLLVISSICFFVIISKGTTNLWYEAPLYPLLSMLIGMGMFRTMQFFYHKLTINVKLKYLIILLIVGGIFFIPYKRIIKKVTKREHSWEGEEIEYGDAIKRMKKEIPAAKTFTIYHDGNYSHLYFYQQINNKAYNYDIKHASLFGDVSVGDTILSCQVSSLEKIEGWYVVEELFYYRDCKLLYIKSKK